MTEEGCSNTPTIDHSEDIKIHTTTDGRIFGIKNIRTVIEDHKITVKADISGDESAAQQYLQKLYEVPGTREDYWKKIYDDEIKRERMNGTTPVITTKDLNPLTIVKLPGIDKIRWRYRNHETVKTSKWNRNHTKVAEFYWFWNIECRNAKMYIPLEEQYNTRSGFEEIPVPKLELRMPQQ